MVGGEVDRAATFENTPTAPRSDLVVKKPCLKIGFRYLLDDFIE